MHPSDHVDGTMGEIVIVVAMGVFVLLIWQVTRAQDADNRNSNSNQSSYEGPPAPGDG